MIVAVTEQYHDHEPHQYFIDTDKLDKFFYVDSLILKECKKKSKSLKIYVDASNWEDDEKFGGEEPGVTSDACSKKNNKPIDKSLYLSITFE